MMIGWGNNKRDVDELVVLGLLILTAAITLLTVIGILVYELINHDSPGSNGIRVIAELCSTLLGVLIGIVAGRGMEKKRQRGDRE